MSSQQVPQSQGLPSAHQLPSKHNITLGPEQTDRKSIPNHDPPHSFSQNYQIQLELKNISRQVSKIAQRTDKARTYGQNSPMGSSFPFYEQQNPISQLQKDLSSLQNPNPNTSNLSKYNYYGREYRFSTQNPVQKGLKSHQPPQSYEDQELNSFSPSTKHHPQNQQLSLPDSKSYYIYFDQPKRQKQLNLKVPQLESKHEIPHKTSHPKDKQTLYGSLNFPKNTNPSHFPQDYDDQARTPPLQVFSKQQAESKWVLEKKVKRLEKQLHQIKKKQQQRQKLRNFTNNNSKKDSKVFVRKQVDHFINSLWP